MSSVLNTSTHAASAAKKPDNSMASGKLRPDTGESGGEFAALFGDMMQATLRQELAAPAAAEGKSSPVSGLASEVLGPSIHIITTAEPATSDESLRAFARAQGMDEQALALIFGQPANAPSMSADADELAGDALNNALQSRPGGLDGRLPSPGQSGSTPPSATTQGTPTPAPLTPGTATNLLELGPDAMLRWSVGDQSPAAAQAMAKELVTPMFGLNGLRTMLPTAAAPAGAADEPAAHPESANQSLAASLMLGASEAGQAARRQQLKQAVERTERLGELTQPAKSAGPLMSAVAELLGQATPETEPAAEPLILETGIDEAELNQLLQHRPAEGRVSDSGQGSNTAATGQRPDIAMRAEQYEKLSQRLGEALGQRLASQIAKGDWKVEMALRPIDLGNIDIELAMKNGGLEASFNASEARTRDLISEGLPRLKEVLAELGMDVASVNVNVRQNGQHGGNPTPGKQSAGVQGVAARRAEDKESGMAVMPPAPAGPSSDDGLDVLV